MRAGFVCGHVDRADAAERRALTAVAPPQFDELQLFHHRWLIRQQPFFGSALAFNPDVTATGAMKVQMPLAVHDERGDAHTSAASAMRTDDGRRHQVGRVLTIDHGQRTRGPVLPQATKVSIAVGCDNWGAV